MAKQTQEQRDPGKLTNHWGEEPPRPNLDKLPDDAPARTGNTTPPSGQGGASPHDGISYQDQFSPNPEPSKSAAEKGKQNEAIDKGEVSPVTGEKVEKSNE